MTDFENLTQLPEDFDNRVRLFPLPDLVVFPNAMQPLHIFEPRYCEMLAEALASDQLIAMATLTTGWENQWKEPPPIAPHVCICRVVSHATTEDDTHNLLVVGLRRARVIEELDTGRPFRTARVELLDDVYPVSGAQARPQLKKQLIQAFQAVIPELAEMQKNLHELMHSQMRLGPVTDIIGFTMDFDGLSKLALLGERNVDQRAKLLIQILEARAAEQAMDGPADSPRRGPFPPPFSLN